LINHILLISSSVIIYEFLKYIKFIDLIKLNLEIYQKIIRLFKFKNVSDFRKEKLILNYSKSLFVSSVKIFLILVSILTVMYILNLLSQSFLNLIISVFGIIELSIVVIIYHQFRKKISAKLY